MFSHWRAILIHILSHFSGVWNEEILSNISYFNLTQIHEDMNMTFNNQQETWGRTDYK